MLENVFRVVVGIDFPTEYILNNSMVIYIYIFFFLYIYLFLVLSISQAFKQIVFSL